LEPTIKPETNYRFLLFLVATLDALYKHSGLLRASIATASNEHRLGANEAPPGIISAFLGEHLTEVLNSIEEGRQIKNFSRPHLQTVKVGGTVLDLKVSTLPQISRDLTDRNRTSPFAFTGNKFEFRAVGSKQSPSLPVTFLNSAVAASLVEVTAALEKQKGSKPIPSESDILAVVHEFTKSSKLVRFEGNNYSDEWVKEAEARGLPNIKTCPVAFRQLLEQKNRDLLVSQGIMTLSEITSRFHIMMEKYVKDLMIEANTLKSMVLTGVIPAVFAYRKELAESLVAQKSLGIDISTAPEKITLDALTKLTNELVSTSQTLVNAIDKMNAMEHLADGIEKQADYAGSKLTALLESVRSIVDEIEVYAADKYWPFPKYTELLF